MRNNTDWIAYKFLKIMEVEVNPFPSFSQNSAWNPNFPAWVANEITEKTFTSSEQEKISSLIEELKKEDPSLIERAYTETKKRISGLGIITGKVFKQLSTVAWKFFGLIEVEKEHFSEVYRFFSQMLSDLGIQGGKRYQKSEVKEYFFKALKKLEELVKSKKKIKTGEKTSNSSNLNRIKQSKPREKKIAVIIKLQARTKGEKESNSPPSEKINPEKLPSSSKSELLELIRKGEKEDDPVKLGKIIEQIEEFRGEKTYESLEPKISALKKKLANQNFKEYLNTNREMIEKELKLKGLKKTS